MTPEAELYSMLTNDAAVFALIGLRVYPIIGPQNGLKPYAVYQRISTVDGYNHGGPDKSPSARIQITSWAETFSTARSVATAISNLLSGFGATTSGQSIQVIFKTMELDNYDPEALLFGVVQDFTVQYSE